MSPPVDHLTEAKRLLSDQKHLSTGLSDKRATRAAAHAGIAVAERMDALLKALGGSS